MSPLLQGAILGDIVRMRVSAGALSSSDLQIKHWVLFRGNHRATPKAVSVRRLQFREEFDHALRQAVGSDSMFNSLKHRLAQDSPPGPDGGDFQAGQHVSNEAAVIGTTTARIGFVLDYARMSPAEDSITGPNTPASLTDEVPWQLAGCNFNKDNVLVWTHDFQAFTTLARSISEVSQAHSPATLARHNSLISSSNLRIVLLCGPRAEKAILAASGHILRSHTLSLGAYKYPIFAQDRSVSLGQTLPLFIRCGEMPSRVWSTDSIHTAKLSEVVRFSVKMLGLEGIRPYFVESSSVIGTIISYARREKQGQTPMTAQTIDPGLRTWLARKGFQREEDICQLEQLGGTLIRGLIAMLHALAQEARQRSTNPPLRSMRKAHGRYSKHEGSAPKRFCQQQHSQIVEFVLKVRIHYESSLVLHQSNLDGRGSRVGTNNPTQEINKSTDLSTGEIELIRDVSNLMEANQEVQRLQGTLYPVTEPQDRDQGQDDNIEDSLITSLRQLAEDSADEEVIADQTHEEQGSDSATFRQQSLLKATVVPAAARRGVSRKNMTSRQKSRNFTKCWDSEVGIFEQKEYPYEVPQGAHYQSCRFHVCYCPVDFTMVKDLSSENRIAFVQIEIRPKEMQHPNMYATSALDTDPACRLAFLIKYTNKDGAGNQFYATNRNRAPLYRANSAVDILADRVAKSVVAKTARRYLAISKAAASDDPTLSQFIKGAYTSLSDNGPLKITKS